MTKEILHEEILPRQEVILNEKIWIGTDSAFRFKEQINPINGEKSFILKGLLLPFEKISRNGVLYNKKSIIDKHKQLIGKPLMYNHQTEGGHAIPLGHVKNSWIDDNGSDGPGWYYEADIDPHETNFIRKLKRGDLRHVSIQLMGEKAFEKFDEKSGKSFTEAFIGDIIELSVVPTPGFLDTTAKFNESLKYKEDVRSTTALGAIRPTQPFDKKKEDHASFEVTDELINTIANKYEFDGDLNELKLGIQVEKEHEYSLPDGINRSDPEIYAKIALDHLNEDPQYYTKLKKIEQSENLAEKLVAEFEENTIKELLEAAVDIKIKEFLKRTSSEFKMLVEANTSSLINKMVVKNSLIRLRQNIQELEKLL